MPKNFLSSRLSRLLIAAAVAAVASSPATSSATYALTAAAPPPPAMQSRESTTNPANAAVPAVVSPRSYVPLVHNNWPANTVFGIETLNLAGQANPIAGTGTTWIRRNTLPWKDIEPAQGARNWSAASPVEADMVAASNNNLRLILTIHGIPAWAQQIPNSFCGPIRQDKINAFATFVRDAVTRYSQPPYNVKYWEIWNEPDLGQPVPPPDSPQIQPYGCWGNGSDPYFGGGYYASVLAAVSPQIRAVDPSAKILLGGLLMDCPPSASCPIGKYLEGVLRGGGAPHFDILSFHAYDFFDATANVLGRYISPNWSSASNTTGPVLIAKVQFIKSLLNQFGVTGKLLMNTEVGLLCFLCAAPPSQQFETSKAYYVPQAYSAAIAEGLAANIWFSFEGWFGTELTEPTYSAFKTARAKLADAGYVGPVGQSDVGVGGVKGYKFNRSGKPVWVIWSLDGGAKNITLPGVPAAITDAVGAAVPAAASLQLTVKPLYVEWP